MLYRAGKCKKGTLCSDGCEASGGPYQQLEHVPHPKPALEKVLFPEAESALACSS